MLKRRLQDRPRLTPFQSHFRTFLKNRVPQVWQTKAEGCGQKPVIKVPRLKDTGGRIDLEQLPDCIPRPIPVLIRLFGARQIGCDPRPELISPIVM